MGQARLRGGCLKKKVAGTPLQNMVAISMSGHWESASSEHADLIMHIKSLVNKGKYIPLSQEID